MIITPYKIVAPSPENSDEILVYNTLSTALIVLDKKTYSWIFENGSYDEKEKRTLLKMGFLADNRQTVLDQLMRLKHRKKEVKQIVTILTTTACNARCYYCFEKGVKSYSMTKQTADAVIDFLTSTFPKKELGINWFGGEPLLNFSIVQYITERLIALGYKLDCHVTTNGSLLTQEMVNWLLKHYSSVTAQITIDEVDEKYGEIKNYVNIDKSKAYKRVLDSISMFSNSGILVSVRINFASTHIEEAKKIYARVEADLETICDKKNLYIYFAPLSLADPKENISGYAGEGEHPFLQAVKIQFEEGYPLNRLKYPDSYDLLASFGLMPHSSSCGMSVPTRFAIDANGDLYKCHRLVGKKEYAVGSVFNGPDVECKYYRLYVDDLITDEECKNCNILPICQGGCKANRIVIGDFAKCHKIKQAQRELLCLYYKALRASSANK